MPCISSVTYDCISSTLVVVYHHAVACMRFPFQELNPSQEFLRALNALWMTCFGFLKPSEWQDYARDDGTLLRVDTRVDINPSRDFRYTLKRSICAFALDMPWRALWWESVFFLCLPFSYHSLGDLSTTLEMTVIFSIVIQSVAKNLLERHRFVVKFALQVKFSYGKWSLSMTSEVSLRFHQTWTLRLPS